MRILILILILAAVLPLAVAPAKPADTVRPIAAWLALSPDRRPADAAALRQPLDRAAAARVLDLLAADRLRTLADERRGAVDAKQITLGDRTLKWMERRFGTAPPAGPSLWISLHGGGNAPPELNDGQWRNQIRLYEPAEGIYIAPRAPTNTWNLWHEAHIDPLLQRLIDDQVAVNGVDPNRVYLMGYSAGGDGVWQLAPRMADRFAAAAMMAGHPGDASLLPLRNLPFAIFMGGEDSAYDRNRLAASKTAELDRLAAENPGAYVHMSRIYPGLPHWMQKKDAEAVPWMAKFARDAWPKTVAWVQDDRTNDRFYWLQIPDVAAAKAGDRIVATVKGQHIALQGDVPAGMILRLSDRLVDLDRPVRVTVNGKPAWRGKVSRNADAMWRSLQERADPSTAAQALLRLG